MDYRFWNITNAFPNFGVICENFSGVYDWFQKYQTETFENASETSFKEGLKDIQSSHSECSTRDSVPDSGSIPDLIETSLSMETGENLRLISKSMAFLSKSPPGYC